MDPQEQKVIHAVDSLSDEIVQLTSLLVAQPSTLGNEAAALQVMEREWRRLGFEPQQVPINPAQLSAHPGFGPVQWDYENRYNLVAVEPGAGKIGRSALFNGHLDVVPPDPVERWAQDPFEPVERDGWLYGRGSGDMKAGVAAMTFALKGVEKAGFGLGAPVTLEAVIEEECSGNGALACLAAGHDAEAVLIPEPFGPTILTSQVGVVWFRVSLTGVSRHALEAASGVNAIEKCCRLFEVLRGLEGDLNDSPPPEFNHLVHPVHLNIGTIKGGCWPSSVPAVCSFDCRLGFFPGTGFQEIRDRIVDTLQRASGQDEWLALNPPEVTFYGFRSEGHSLESDLPAFQLLDACHQSLGGKPAEPYVSTATTDLRAFVHFGQGQATCFGPVAENIHAENERVNLESVFHTAKVYALFLARWCGLME